MRCLVVLAFASFAWGQLALTGPATCGQGQTCQYTASSGSPSYTYSLVSGSVGYVNPTTGAYTAPPKVAAKQVMGGCQAFPNDSIFNTRIDGLPKHAQSDLWISNMNKGIISTGGGMRITTVLSTDTPTAMLFYYTTGNNGNFIFPSFPDRFSEAGGAFTAPGALPGRDNHFFNIYRDTCKLQENYQLYSPGFYLGEPGTVNSQSGLISDLKDNVSLGLGTDAAGLPLANLITHQDELIAAAKGNIDAIQHATRVTLDPDSFNPAISVWPAYAPGGASGKCAGPATGGATYTVTANGGPSITVPSLHAFRGWPAGTTVVIDGSNYTVSSFADPDPAITSSGWSWGSIGYYMTLTLTANVATGTHSLILPITSCAKYGDRIRLISSYVPTFPPTCNIACQNVALAVVRQQQRYGMIIADAGGVGNGQADGDYGSPDISAGLAVVQCYTSGCLLLNATSPIYEVVDESSLQTARNQVGTDDNWWGVKVNNLYVTPDSAAVVKVTDSLAASAYYSVSLRAIVVGAYHPNEVVIAGAAPFVIPAWVTGSSTATYSCTAIPSGGKYGTITKGCLYTPPAKGTIPLTEITETSIIIMADADRSARKTVALQIIPVDPVDGKAYISLGKASASKSYAEGGHTWINDRPYNMTPSLTPDSAMYQSSGWSDYSGTYVASYPTLFTSYIQVLNDVQVRVHVPNGSNTGTFILGNPASAINVVGFSFDCNGNQIVAQKDLFTHVPLAQGVAPLTCTQTVADGVLNMVVRRQGVNLISDGSTGCGIPCYSQSSVSFAAALGGLIITPPATTPLTYKKFTVCASGCDYTLTGVPLADSTVLYNVMLAAVSYQDSTACIPVIIEATGTIQMSGVPFPAKKCSQYIEMRSSKGAHFTPGQRYTPASDDAYAFSLQASKVAGNSSVFGTVGGTSYWRFRNVNFFTDDSGGSTRTITNATWSGQVATITYSGAALSTGIVSVSGISPVGFNTGSTANSLSHFIGLGSNTILYYVATDPGPYTSGGTITELYTYGVSDFLTWGGFFDRAEHPHHLEILQSSFNGEGDGDVYHGVNVNGDHVRIIDSYFAGIQHPQSDAGPIIGGQGDYLEIRNTHLDGGDETMGFGGGHVAAGTLPRFMYFIGNSISKPTWNGTVYGNGAPGSQPCFEGKWYHDNTANRDYLCSSVSGVWNIQGSLLTKSQRAPKNLTEWKMGLGIRMVGNDFGYVPAQTGQGGTSIVFNLVSQPQADPTCPNGLPRPCTELEPWITIADVNISANRFRDNLSPFGMAYAIPGPCRMINRATNLPYTPCYNYGHHNISFTHNLITGASDERGYCATFDNDKCLLWSGGVDYSGPVGPATLEGTAYDVDISNNTHTTSKFSAASGIFFGFGSNISQSSDYSGMLHMRNNIVPIGGYGFPGGADWDGTSNPSNGCGFFGLFRTYGGAPDLRKNILTNDPPTGHTWVAFTNGTVSPACATGTSTIWPTDHAGGMSWAWNGSTGILNTSTFKVANPAYQGWGTDGRDPGADVDLVNWRTAHALDGAPNPKLDYRIKSITTTATGASIYFSAPSDSACTWEMSTNAGSYASPVAVTSQTRNGRGGVATWTGNLTPETTYFARSTCGGDKVEHLFNGDRAKVITGPSPVIPVISYDMFNGVWHAIGFADLTYTGGTGNPLLAHAALAGGKGLLTDGILGHTNPASVHPLDQYNILSTVITQPGGPGTADIFTFTLDRPNDITGGEVDFLQIDGNYSIDFIQAYTASNSPSVVQTDRYGSSLPGSITPLTGATLTRLLQDHGVDAGSWAYNWGGWALDPTDGDATHIDSADTFATMKFHFAAPAALNQISVYEANLAAYGISCFDTATIDFSMDGTTWTGVGTGSTVYTASGDFTTGDRKDRTTHWVNMPVSHTAQHVRIHFAHTLGTSYPTSSGCPAGTVNCYNFIVLSEVQFR